MADYKAKIAVFVSGGGTNLQAIIDAQNSGLIEKGKVVLVVASREESGAIKRAENAGIETHVVNKKSYSNEVDFENRLKELIDGHEIDLIVLAGYRTILSKDFVRYYDHKIINIHPALIPAFSGEGMYAMNMHKAALDRGVKVSGATVHYVNEVPDGGEIIAQKAVNVEEGDTPETLKQRIRQQAEWLILPVAIAKICRKIAAEKENA